MTKTGWNLSGRLTTAFAVALMALSAALTSESQAQARQSLEVRLRASPSVGIARMDEGAQRIFADEMPRLTEMFKDQTRGAGFVTISSGFSVLAYENITVLISFTAPAGTRPNSDDPDARRITCGYLNDGTTYFMRATVTNEGPIQFRLRNANLLRRSMRLNDPLFVAHVFFLFSERKKETRYDDTISIPTVTVEFI